MHPHKLATRFLTWEKGPKGPKAFDKQPHHRNNSWFPGGVPEWLKGADCKSVGLRLRWFESNLLHQGRFSRNDGFAVLQGVVGLGVLRAGVAQW